MLQDRDIIPGVGVDAAGRAAIAAVRTARAEYFCGAELPQVAPAIGGGNKCFRARHFCSHPCRRGRFAGERSQLGSDVAAGRPAYQSDADATACVAAGVQPACGQVLELQRAGMGGRERIGVADVARDGAVRADASPQLQRGFERNVVVARQPRFAGQDHCDRFPRFDLHAGIEPRAEVGADVEHLQAGHALADHRCKGVADLLFELFVGGFGGRNGGAGAQAHCERSASKGFHRRRACARRGQVAGGVEGQL